MTLAETPLLDWTPRDYDASGKTYNPKKDMDAISRQCRAVWAVVKDGEWYSLERIKELTGAPEASVSARIRDLSNKHGCTYEKKRDPNHRGLWWYRFEPLCEPRPQPNKNGAA